MSSLQKGGQLVSKYAEQYNLFRNYLSILSVDNDDVVELLLCLPQYMVDVSYSITLGMVNGSSEFSAFI